MAKIKVLIADDHAVLRAGLKLLISAQADMEVVGEAANSHETFQKVSELFPDVVSLDLNMPGTAALKLVERLRREYPKVRVLVLTMHDDPAYFRAALTAGVAGYVVKTAVDAELLTAIRALYAGKTFIDPSLAGELVQSALGQAQCHAVVVGVGAVGRQVALQLAALGMPRLTLVDQDLVSVENLAPQSYWPSDLGQTKVEATAALCRQINPDIQVQGCPERFRRSLARALIQDDRLVLFSCVDSITARKTIWESVRSFTALLVDGRMNAEVIRVLAWDSANHDDLYSESLFAQEDAFTGACTARSTIYAASIAAGLMVGQLARWLRQLDVIADQTLNLLAGELSLSPDPIAT